MSKSTTRLVNRDQARYVIMWRGKTHNSVRHSFPTVEAAIEQAVAHDYADPSHVIDMKKRHRVVHEFGHPVQPPASSAGV